MMCLGGGVRFDLMASTIYIYCTCVTNDTMTDGNSEGRTGKRLYYQQHGREISWWSGAERLSFIFTCTFSHISPSIFSSSSERCFAPLFSFSSAFSLLQNMDSGSFNDGNELRENDLNSFLRAKYWAGPGRL